MSKSAKKAADQAEREKVHKRYSNRREPDVIYPAKKQVDFYDADIHQCIRRRPAAAGAEQNGRCAV